MIKLENLILVVFALMALVGFISFTDKENPIVGKWNLTDIDVEVQTDDSQLAEQLKNILIKKYTNGKFNIGNIFVFHKDGSLRAEGYHVGNYSVIDDSIKLSFTGDLDVAVSQKFKMKNNQWKMYCNELNFAVDFLSNNLVADVSGLISQAMVTLQFERI